MDVDELEPRPPEPRPKNLESMSVEELEGYIGDLEAEIARAREVIAGKRRTREGAETLFRK